MRYVSLFTGIGGFDLGLDRAGMECVLQVEQDKHCLKLLRNRWPTVPKMEDVRDVEKIPAVSLVCGGFPCQDLSVAGKRKGLAGERSGLWQEFHRILRVNAPRWVVIENVPGLLSSNGGRDFAVILRGLEKCGYHVAWRVLDLQHWGVPQRRRRVFIVGSLGDGRCAEVLFERDGLPWHPQKGREKRPGLARDVAASLRTGSKNTGGPAGGMWEDGLTVFHENKSSHVTGSDTARSLRAGASHSYQMTVSPTLNASGAGRSRPGGQGAEPEFYVAEVARTIRPSIEGRSGTNSDGTGNFVARPLKAGGNSRHDESHETYIASTVTSKWAKQNGGPAGSVPKPSHCVPNTVRRLTPLECERLQGFPDGWTEGFADTVRYRMLGNAVGVPVAQWIAGRIVAISEAQQERQDDNKRGCAAYTSCR